MVNMRHLRADVKSIKISSGIPQGATKLWENDSLALYYLYNPSQCEVIWIFVNKTSERKLVSLLRGAVLNINGQQYAVPEYIFGNAFADVYFGNGASTYINDLNDIPLYSLAILRPPSNRLTVGFVFSLPPNSVVCVPEYGFVNLVSLSGRLIEVKPGSINLYAIIYDYAEVIEYEQEAGITVASPPDPYAVFSYCFSIDEVGTVVTPRVIIEIPQTDVKIANDIINFFKKIAKWF
ncbi:hypothetical protein AFV8_gp57 [Betalipothrixvirus puteoliense]|uniref:Uncharacterized protein n=1 Tax=Betalipothrixvirus puteoliense TaxID=346884 RepID=A7WKY6_9VIRU|nr:hypothetical protein AFV8_gp57 [Acidianus filamentous virus 8]CAJ31734.1 conserved hypothetical protein [Acidianus filamentous virus 8]